MSFNLGLDDISVNNEHSVPDASTTLSLFGAALLGLVSLRRRVAAK